MTDQEFQNGISVLLERVNTRQSGTLLGMLRSRLVSCSAAELTAASKYVLCCDAAARALPKNRTEGIQWKVR